MEVNPWFLSPQTGDVSQNPHTTKKGFTKTYNIYLHLNRQYMYIYIYALIFIYSYINVILVIYKKHLAPLFPKHRRFWVSWRSKNPKPNLIALHWQRPWRHGFNLYSTFWTNTYAQRGRLRVVAKKIWVEKKQLLWNLAPMHQPQKNVFPTVFVRLKIPHKSLK